MHSCVPMASFSNPPAHMHARATPAHQTPALRHLDAHKCSSPALSCGNQAFRKRRAVRARHARCKAPGNPPSWRWRTAARTTRRGRDAQQGASGAAQPGQVGPVAPTPSHPASHVTVPADTSRRHANAPPPRPPQRCLAAASPLPWCRLAASTPPREHSPPTPSRHAISHTVLPAAVSLPICCRNHGATSPPLRPSDLAWRNPPQPRPKTTHPLLGRTKPLVADPLIYWTPSRVW